MTTTNELLFNALSEKINEEATAANDLAKAIRASKAGNPEKAAEKYVKKSDLAEVPAEVSDIVKNFREGRDKTLAALAAKEAEVIAAVSANLPNTELSPEDVASRTASYKAHAEKFKSYRKSMVDLGEDVATKEQIESLPKLLTLGGGGSGSTGATGRKKPRFSEITLDGKSIAKIVDDKRVCTPTVLAEAINSRHSDDKSWLKVSSAEIVDLALNQNPNMDSEVTLKSFRGEHDIVLTPKDTNAVQNDSPAESEPEVSEAQAS